MDSSKYLLADALEHVTFIPRWNDCGASRKRTEKPGNAWLMSFPNPRTFAVGSLRPEEDCWTLDHFCIVRPK
jgi:hypothetical protein